MEIWIDPEIDEAGKTFTGGTKIAEIEYPAVSSDWTRWQTFDTPVMGLPKGKHTVVLKFLVGGGSAENQNYGSLNWVDFTVIEQDFTLEQIVPVESSVAVNVELSQQLEVTFEPADAYPRELQWELVSAEPADAVVLSAEGRVTGVRVGKAVVRASSTKNSDIYADFDVEVVDALTFENMRLEAESAIALYDTYHFGNQSSISAGNITDPEDEGGKGLNSCWNTNFAVYEHVDFKDGVTKAMIRKGYVRGSKMEIWVDPEIDAEKKTFSGGVLIGSVEYPKPAKDDWSRWQTFEIPITGCPAGVHTVVLRFLAGGGSGKDKNYGSLNWIDFRTYRGTTSGLDTVSVESGLTICRDGRVLSLRADKDTEVTVCSIDGRIVAHFMMEAGHCTIDNLSSGFYIINGHKVVIG